MRTAPPRSAPRALALLLIGHVAVAAGVVVLVVLLALGRSTHPAEPLAGSWSVDVLAPAQLFIGLGALGLAQGLSIHRLLAHRRGHVDDPRGGLAAPALAGGMQRLEWTMVLAFYPIVSGVTALLRSPPPAPLLALSCVLPCASLLLDQAHAGWAHRHLDGRGPRTLLLPPGCGERLRRKLRGPRALLIGLAVIAALLAAASVDHVLARGGASLIGLLAPVAAGAAAVPALLLVGPVRRVRGALRGNVVDLLELDSAARAMRRVGPSGALGAALLAAAVLTGSAGPRLALAAAVPLAVTLGVLSVQLGLALRVRLGVPFGDGDRRIGGARTR